MTTAADPEPSLHPESVPADEVARVCDAFLSQAVDEGASDVHLNALGAGLLVRFRTDGQLRDVRLFSPDTGRRITSHLKVLAGLDISEHRRPQDGRVACWVSDREVDLRVTTLGTLHGENAAIRVFDRSRSLRDLDELGLDRSAFHRVLDLIHSPQGLILVSGPTGAGKTTTLYAILQRLNRADRNIVTVEDPIEYDIDRVNQIAVQGRLSLGFAECLRSVLRQDPDVLMIGEIRDAESARIAIRAALAGHLVLTTLHTGTAAGAISALVHYHVEPFLAASALAGVIAQQLVRLICPGCRKRFELEIDDLGPEEAREIRGVLGPREKPSFSYGEGCERCRGTGYRGRTGIFEVLSIHDAIREAILRKRSAREIDQAARVAGMRTLRMSGFAKIVGGLTTIEEVLRVVPVPEEIDADLARVAAPRPAAVAGDLITRP